MNAEALAIRGLIAVAVGVAVLLGVAGAFLYQRNPEEQRTLHQREFARQHRTEAEVRSELIAQYKKRRRVAQEAKRKSSSTAGTEVVTHIDQKSVVDTDDDDDDDEEFFDCSDGNNV